VRLERLELVTHEPPSGRARAKDAELAAVARSFPTVAITCAIDAAGACAPAPDTVDAAVWCAEGFDFWTFDRQLDRLAAARAPLRVRAPVADAAAIVREVLTRAQRLAPRTNPASATAWFARVLDEHRAVHDVARPLVQADLDHALDTWQWALRLDPAASAQVQLASLCHDIERLVSEADRRVEHHAVDYQAFKDAHARAGARLAATLFARAGVPEPVARGAIELIARHERTGEDPAIRALNDADALSFFALNSPGYLAYFGPAQTRSKVAYTLARMSPEARELLAGLRLPQLVRQELLRLA